MNRAKEKLKAGGTVLVFNPNFPAPSLVEFAGSLGFDVAFIDCEHGTADFERVEELARAARAAGMTSILRPWSMERGLVTRYLDCGVGGIQFPGIGDAQAARQAVDIVRSARGMRFGDTLVCMMIESADAIGNLPSITAVEGIDVIVVGLADLASSLGHAGEVGHPDVRAAVDRIVSHVRAGSRGTVAGFNLHRWEEGPGLIGKGVRWLTVHARTLLVRGTGTLRDILGLEGEAR
jgi:4-hydroxy-2-oxoheptanedioate aldolase